MARPPKTIDEKRVAELAYDGASNREIGDILGIDDKTVANRFSALLRKRRAERRLKLRQVQFETALDGNATMQIWLGKQELEQNDKVPTGPPEEKKPRIIPARRHARSRRGS